MTHNNSSSTYELALIRIFIHSSQYVERLKYTEISSGCYVLTVVHIDHHYVVIFEVFTVVKMQDFLGCDTVVLQ